MQDPQIMYKLHTTKLVKWKYFLFLEKMIDFDRDLLYDMFNMVRKHFHSVTVMPSSAAARAAKKKEA